MDIENRDLGVETPKARQMAPGQGFEPWWAKPTGSRVQRLPRLGYPGAVLSSESGFINLANWHKIY